MNKNVLYISIFVLAAGLLSACKGPAEVEANMPNPAAQFCESRGYTYEIRPDSEGNQYGICVFSPDEECDGWAYYRGECGPGISPTQPSIEPTQEPVPTADPLPELETYRNETFRFELKYPPDWNLRTSSPGDHNPPSSLLEFSRGNWLLSVHIKLLSDLTVIGGAIGPGDNLKVDSIDLLGRSINGNARVYEGKIYSIYYAAQTSDLEIYTRLEGTENNPLDIEDERFGEVKAILESLIRTGDPLPLPEPTAASSPTQAVITATCSLNPQLVVGIQAEITPGLPNTLRSAPGREYDSQVIGSIPGGGIVNVLDGPICKSGYNWWKVEYGSLVGWTAEGFGGTYWILTYPSSGDEQAPASEEVDGWVGVVVSAEDLPQVDDYFQMMDQDGSRYGIHSLDADLREALEAYRDTGTAIKIWGTLYRERMDAYNTQIEVTRIEEF